MSVSTEHVIHIHDLDQYVSSGRWHNQCLLIIMKPYFFFKIKHSENILNIVFDVKWR